MRLLKEKLEGEILPFGYAPCYPLFDRRMIMCAPIGLHFVIRYGRAAYRWVRQLGWYSYIAWEQSWFDRKR